LKVVDETFLSNDTTEAIPRLLPFVHIRYYGLAAKRTTTTIVRRCAVRFTIYPNTILGPECRVSIADPSIDYRKPILTSYGYFYLHCFVPERDSTPHIRFARVPAYHRVTVRFCLVRDCASRQLPQFLLEMHPRLMYTCASLA